MNTEAKIFLIASVVVIICSFIFTNLQEPPEPKEFVKNKTFANYSTLFFNYEITRYPSSVEIKSIKLNETTIIGFVTDPWNINFGIIPGNGTFVKRNIELTNLKDKDSKIILKTYGNITPLVSFSKNNFILHTKEKVSIDVFLFSNKTEIGNYSGEIDIIIQKPIYNFLSIS